MDIIKSDDFRREMKKGLSGGYLFFGEEDYLKLHTLNSARAAICPEESFAFFNDMRIDALDLTAQSLLDALMPLPMMADKKIVTVSGFSSSMFKPSEIDAICEAFEALDDYDYNVLIVSVPAGAIDEGYLPKRPSAIFNKLSKKLRPVQFEAPSRAKLLAWCSKHFEHNGVSCPDELIIAMFERCGTSMFTLAAEIDKLSFYARSHGRNNILKEDIPLVTCATIETDAFALANSLLDGKNSKALEALAVMKYNRVEPVIVLSEISRVISDLALVKALSSAGKTAFEINNLLKMRSEYKAKVYIAGAASKSEEKLKAAIELCAEADRLLKSSGGGYDVIEQLLATL